jgi:hypothetical protein
VDEEGVKLDVAEYEVELDGVGVEDELGKAKTNIAGVEGEFTVAGVKGTLEDDVGVEASKEGTRPAPCRIHSCNGLTDEHAPRGCTFLSFASAV